MKAIKTHQLLVLASAALLSTSFFGCGRPTNEVSGLAAYGGCIPITETNIPFTAQNAYVDTMNIRAGVIPGGYTYGYNQSIGTVFLGGNVTGGTYGKQSPQTYSTIQMNYAPATQYGGVGALPGAYQNYGYQGVGQQATFTGTLTITDQERQAIAQYLQTSMNNGTYNVAAGGTSFVNGYQPSVSACISGLAFNFQYQGYALVGGYVYLYLNNMMLAPHTIRF